MLPAHRREIVTVIKGSTAPLEVSSAEQRRLLAEEEALERPCGRGDGDDGGEAAATAAAAAAARKAAAARSAWLSRADYVALSARVASTFAGEERRNAVYDIFERYEILKREARMFDIADVVAHIARQQRVRPLGQSADALTQVFVDEVQDVAPTQLLLLLWAVPSASSLFAAGDTAQTIASGVGFRFEELKALIYREDARHKEREEAARVATKGEARANKAAQAPAPVLHTLRVNYRSHNGLVRAAAAVSGLLTDLFPDTVDRLPPELGCFDGPRPLLMTMTRVMDMLTCVLDGEKSADGVAEVLDFGANQVILVRNDAARSRLLVDAPELAMAKAQILTVAEAKGLEYNDVFIWDLCADSPCKAEWRAVAHAAASLLESRGLLPEEQFPPSADILPHFQPLPFDPRAHALLGECLKLFYVAMTRARRRVVVFDRCPRQRAALFAFLGSAVWGAAPPLACAPASTSSAEESGSAGEGGTALFPVAELCGLVQFRKGVKGSSKSGDIEKSGAVRPAAGLAQAGTAFRNAQSPERVCAALGKLAFLRGEDSKEEEERRALLLWAAILFFEGGQFAEAGDALQSAGERALAQSLTRASELCGGAAAHAALAERRKAVADAVRQEQAAEKSTEEGDATRAELVRRRCEEAAEAIGAAEAEALDSEPRETWEGAFLCSESAAAAARGAAVRLLSALPPPLSQGEEPLSAQAEAEVRWALASLLRLGGPTAAASALSRARHTNRATLLEAWATVLHLQQMVLAGSLGDNTSCAPTGSCSGGGGSSDAVGRVVSPLEAVAAAVRVHGPLIESGWDFAGLRAALQAAQALQFVPRPSASEKAPARLSAFVTTGRLAEAEQQKQREMEREAADAKVLRKLAAEAATGSAQHSREAAAQQAAADAEHMHHEPKGAVQAELVAGDGEGVRRAAEAAVAKQAAAADAERVRKAAEAAAAKQAAAAEAERVRKAAEAAAAKQAAAAEAARVRKAAEAAVAKQAAAADAERVRKAAEAAAAKQAAAAEAERVRKAAEAAAAKQAAAAEAERVRKAAEAAAATQAAAAAAERVRKAAAELGAEAARSVAEAVPAEETAQARSIATEERLESLGRRGAQEAPSLDPHQALAAATAPAADAGNARLAPHCVSVAAAAGAAVVAEPPGSRSSLADSLLSAFSAAVIGADTRLAEQTEAAAAAVKKAEQLRLRALAAAEEAAAAQRLVSEQCARVTLLKTLRPAVITAASWIRTGNDALANSVMRECARGVSAALPELAAELEAIRLDHAADAEGGGRGTVD